ncbi:Uncharacterised protein [Mycobacteroides abscessus subsp. abscessus]|uniref:hypothetical protein n=1 Tax=Mycobacteroides abscessus TaxID=36809 RepID=UPI0009A88293|nr:hypothetical protein [Mycobacteroides abscessus]SLJ23450.1 Uncharacterised protein [Mycobacteroides abscessus subsp. abscessus]
MDQERIIAAYRRAGQEIAREQPNVTTATVIYAGVIAETAHRWETGRGDGGDTFAYVTIEMLAGDVLASRAAQELDAIDALRVSNWMLANHGVTTEQAQNILATEAMESRDTRREDSFATAAVEVAAASGDVPARELAYVAACAAARCRAGDNWEALTAEEREELLAATTLGHPVWVTGRDQLPRWRQDKTPHWVYERWGQIEAGAETLIAAQASLAPVNVEQRVAIARHEVRHGIWKHLRDGLDRLDAGDARKCTVIVEYTESVAEGLVRWEAGGGDPGGADAAMAAHVATDLAADADTVMTADARDRLRGLVRERWTQLAPPP